MKLDLKRHDPCFGLQVECLVVSLKLLVCCSFAVLSRCSMSLPLRLAVARWTRALVNILERKVLQY